MIRKTLLVNGCYNMIGKKGMKGMIGWFMWLGILVVICLSLYLITWEVGYEREYLLVVVITFIGCNMFTCMFESLRDKVMRVWLEV